MQDVASSIGKIDEHRGLPMTGLKRMNSTQKKGDTHRDLVSMCVHVEQTSGVAESVSSDWTKDAASEFKPLSDFTANSRPHASPLEGGLL